MPTKRVLKFKSPKYDFNFKPHIAEMLRVMQQKVKIARIEVNSNFEEDLKMIIEDRAMTKVASRWKNKLSKSRQQSTLSLFDKKDNNQIRYQNILDGFQCAIDQCEKFFCEYTQAEEEALVQLIYHSERLFQEKSEIRRRCQEGEFIKKLISHSRHSLCHDPTAKHVISDAGQEPHFLNIKTENFLLMQIFELFSIRFFLKKFEDIIAKNEDHNA